MKGIVKVFLEEPVVVLGAIVGVAAVLAAEGVISPWVSAAILAALLPVQRHFAKPALAPDTLDPKTLRAVLDVRRAERVALIEAGVRGEALDAMAPLPVDLGDREPPRPSAE